jgi:dTDP-glucose 4,6-dehydratase
MNIFGERQHSEKFIPKTVKAILNGKKVIIHGTPQIGISSRCWVHAREVCNALLFLTEHGKPEEFYHVVGEEKSVLYLANKICQIIKKRELLPSEIEFVDFHSTRPGHDIRYALDGRKLRKMGFKYTMSFESSFEKMIKWMIKAENRKWLNL